VSKTPAPRTPPKAQAKKAAPTKASRAVSAASKAPVKSPAKAAPKVLAKAPVKPPVKVAAKTVTPIKKPITKPAPPPPKAKPTAAPAIAAKAAPAVKTPAMKSAPPPAVPTTPATPAVSPAAAKKSARNASKYGAPAVQAPLPPPTSRFADRFAPPRPPTRQMNNLELDTPRQAQKSDPKLANAWKTKSGRDLSEPELLAMPESEYMNDKQLEFFRVKLQTLKDDLLSNAGETTEHLREDTSIVPDPADRATIEEEHALELRTRDRERKLLKKISQSLTRIESGDYGFCDETGEPIGLGRLIARPTATLSLEAQQRRELKQKMYGD
jgi:DnaK suppressor protein